MRTMISSGILVSGILLIRKLAKRKISRRLQYAIWLTLPVLILLTPVISFDIAIPSVRSGNHAAAVNTQPVAVTQGKDGIPEDETNFADLTVASGIPVYNRAKIKSGYLEITDTVHTKTDILRIWNIIRYLVTAMLIIFIAVKNFAFGIRLIKSRAFYKKDLETGMNVYTVPDRSAPFLFLKGIYLNEDNLANSIYLRYMIIHEYCHYKQGDIIWNVVKYTFLTVYWFNPFIWLALYFINIDCELSCDESVVKFIGDENKEDYGMSLIALLGSRQNRFSIETSMRSRKSLIKERINILSNTKSFSKTASVIACCFVFLLAGCSLIQPYENNNGIKNETGIKKSYKVKSIHTEKSGNSYYNSIKKDGDTFYFCVDHGLYKFNGKTLEGEYISEGYFLLGNISGGYLYYLKDPDSGLNPGIGRLDLSTGEEQLLLPWADNALWFCNNVYGKGGNVYIEVLGQCRAYSINDGKAVRLNQKDNIFYNAVNRFDLSDKGAFVINHGYINSIDDYSKFTLRNSDTKELFICDTDTLKVTKKDGCFGNVIICDKGIIYTKTNGDIMLCSLDEPDNEKKLFSADTFGYAVDVRAYSVNGLYAFKKNEDDYECKHIYWQDGINDGPETCDSMMYADLGMSAFNDCTAYLKDERLIINVFGSENEKAGNKTYRVSVTPDKRNLNIEMSDSP